MPARSWLLLLYSLPATHKTERVAIWRKLKKTGAIQVKTSTYLLPNEPHLYELFQWLAKEVRDYGGESTLIRAQEIEGLSDQELIGMFNSAREMEYAEVAAALRGLLQSGKKKRDQNFADELEKLTKQFRAIRDVDFFDAPRGRDAESLLREAQDTTKKKKPALHRLAVKHYQGKKWLTRPRPEIDRVASAWLILRFIDPKAKFVFGSKVTAVPNAQPFDFPNAEFSHHGEDCTFETLLKRFGIGDTHLRKIGEMVHDADLEDGKFQRNECIGIDRVLKGWAKRGVSDDEILGRGFECFDGLYSFLRRR